jgi:hypothetical protein
MTLTCANHPGVETTLRCNKCEKPICAKCAIRTATGYRCPECVRGQQKLFDTAEWIDYVLGFVVALIFSGIASALINLVGFLGFFAYFIAAAAAPTAGAILAEAVRFVIRRHRSRSLFITITVAVILGAAPTILWNLMIFDWYSLIFQGIFLALVVPTVYTRLSGIQIFK